MKIISKLVNKLGFSIERLGKIPRDMDENFHELYQKCKPYTMTSVERLYAVYKAVEYIANNKIEGDFVECGVWRGGSSMMMALSLKHFGITDRKLYLYDTFEGMSAPTSEDVSLTGTSADELLSNTSDKLSADSVWCEASLDDVQANLKKTQYPFENLKFVQGKVEDTIPNIIPKQIAILRLDTDWYESTKHELEHLFPLLNKGGVLIIDDYGHWMGARKAVDEYFNKTQTPILLNRSDYTGRIGIKF